MSPQAFYEKERVVRHAIQEFLMEINPDVIHVHNWHYFSPVPLRAVIEWRRAHPAALVLTAHNSWHDNLFTQMSEDQNEYDAIIAVSRYIRTDMAAWGYDGAKIEVVHHGVPSDWLTLSSAPWHPFRQNGRRPIIFHPARMSTAKGSLVVIDAFRKVREVIPDAVLCLAGASRTVDWASARSREIALIEDRIRRYGLTEAVDIRTYTWPKIVGVYDAAAVVVYPSVFAEPFGIVVIEAMARGRPVIISRSGGMPEIVTHGRDGWIVNPEDVDALAHALTALLSDQELAAALGRQARERVAAEFTAEQMIDRTEAVLLRAREVRMSHGQPVAS
jgi:glycosyltransferase involved in cell wall biosynthesis